MLKKIFSRILSFLPQILALLFILVFAVYAWIEPSQAPPGGNVPAPLNVGTEGQSKAGGLILNTGGAIYGLVADKGNVGIGTVSPGRKLTVVGEISVVNNKIIDVANPTNPQDVATKNYVDSNDAKGLYGWVKLSPVFCSWVSSYAYG